MPDEKQSRSCVFCDQAPVTAEHAWPQWIGKVFAKAYGQADWKMNQQDREWTTKKLDGKVKRVCEACNRGWMSDLENAVRPILEPMILGLYGQVSLSPDDQGLVAFWAVKTAFMTSFLEHERTFTDAAHKELFATRRVPQNGIVWVAAYRGDSVRLVTHGGKCSLEAAGFIGKNGIIQREPVKLDGAVRTNRLGSVIFQTLIYEGDHLPLLGTKHGTGPNDQRIWPVVDRILPWPTNTRALDDLGFLLYAERKAARLRV